MSMVASFDLLILVSSEDMISIVNVGILLSWYLHRREDPDAF